MPDKPDERLIILLPPELLEEVRRAAEDADLSVSQIVRRAIRNELKAIARQEEGYSLANDSELLKILVDNMMRGRPGQASKQKTEVVPGATLETEKAGPTDADKILRTLRERK